MNGVSDYSSERYEQTESVLQQLSELGIVAVWRRRDGGYHTVRYETPIAFAIDDLYNSIRFVSHEVLAPPSTEGPSP